ncbi:AAA family ATPase, partial [Streptomyces sp. NPDC003943]
MTQPYACTTPVRVPPPVGGREELVGRGSESGHIAALLAAARAGRGGALVVTGEPGSGKTR